MDNEEYIYKLAVELIKKHDYCSISFLQRKLAIGFPRAAKIFNELIQNGLVDSESTTRGHKVLVKSDVDLTNYVMLGALIGDTIGSSFEWHNIRRKDFVFYTPRTKPTDDSFMSCAVALTLAENAPIDFSEKSQNKIKADLIKNMYTFYLNHPYAGFGGRFYKWLESDDKKPYNSFGNGAGMRVSPVGWICNSLEEVKILSKTVTEVTHDHVEGIKGAEAIAVCIFLARNGKDKEYIRQYVIDNYYPRLATLNYDDLVAHYEFDETCQGSVPEAIYTFLISKDFEDCVRTSISIGGDSDTVACMACSIAEAYYKDIPAHIKDCIGDYWSIDMIEALNKFNALIKK